LVVSWESGVGNREKSRRARRLSLHSRFPAPNSRSENRQSETSDVPQSTLPPSNFAPTLIRSSGEFTGIAVARRADHLRRLRSTYNAERNQPTVGMRVAGSSVLAWSRQGRGAAIRFPALRRSGLRRIAVATDAQRALGGYPSSPTLGTCSTERSNVGTASRDLLALAGSHHIAGRLPIPDSRLPRTNPQHALQPRTPPRTAAASAKEFQSRVIPAGAASRAARRSRTISRRSALRRSRRPWHAACSHRGLCRLRQNSPTRGASL
jgi:hypothetical protein